MQTPCTGVARQLLRELGAHFPSHLVMDALGVVYSQYWLQPKAKEYFSKHLSILLEFYYNPKLVKVDKVKWLFASILD